MNWTTVKDFREAGVAVTVSATDTYRPMYSFSIWKTNAEENVFRFFPMRFRSHNGKVEAEPSVASVIAKLVAQAEQWAKDAAQVREDEIIEEMAARERAEADKGKQKKNRGTHGK